MSRPLPTPSLVVLVGAPASGKSTWAQANFRPEQIVSSDRLRGIVGEHELDLEATVDAFDLLDRVVEMRVSRGLTTVIDTTGVDAERRRRHIEQARVNGLSAVVVRFTTSAAECRRRNRERRHPVPSKALDVMLKAARDVDLSDEPWDLVLEPEPVRMVSQKLHAAAVEYEVSDRTTQPVDLRFGLLVSSFDWSGGVGAMGAQLARIAQDAEAAGFDSLWVMDHMIQIPQVGRAWDPMLESYTTLGFIAHATSTIRLGVLVSAVTFRNIGHLAKIVATLDVLSGGRAITGLGAGNSQREHVAYGWAFPSAPDRLALLEDALQALPLLWGPGSPPFEGGMLSIPDTTSYPRPIQDPMPIIVGGSGERVTLRLAAQYASGCNLFGSADAVAEKVEVLHRHCADLGRDPAEIEITHLGDMLLGSDGAHLADQIEQLRPANSGPDRYAEAVNAGTVDDHEAGFRHLAAAGVQTAIVAVPNVADPTVFPAFAELIARFRTT
jgi:F420-dependent oxidoreductase-like protein